MKRIAFLSLIILTAFAFNSCKDEIAGTEFLNYVSLEANMPTVIVEQGSSTDVEVHLYATKASSSDRTFAIEVVDGLTTANSESYTVPANVTIPANASSATINVTVADNNLGEDPVTLGFKVVGADDTFIGNNASLTIQKHCTLDINDFIGTYTGETEGGWGATQVVTSLDNDGNLQITGIGVAFLTGYWGEVITSMETLPVNLDPESGDFTIDLAPYITTTYNGDPQATYYLVATGNLNACSGKMYLYYDFVQEGVGSYVEYFGDQAYFTEIISVE
jgi:hypothetical protein